MATLRMSEPWRDPRTGIYYLRKRIPQRYRAVAGRAAETIKISTGTSDGREAKRRWPDMLLQWEALEVEWEELLRAVAITSQTAEELAAGWAAWIAGGGPLDMGGEDDDVFAPWAIASARTPDRLARMYARAEAHADEALRLAGMTITPDTRPLLIKAMLPVAAHAYVQGPRSGVLVVNPKRPLRTSFDAFRTLLPTVPYSPAMPAPALSALSFAGLFNIWEAVAVVKPRTKAELRYTLEALKAFVGHDDAGRVTREDMARWWGPPPPLCQVCPPADVLQRDGSRPTGPRLRRSSPPALEARWCRPSTARRNGGRSRGSPSS